MSGETEEHLYGIGAVSKLTGLTDHTIRVWERRYRAVVAGRAANGRRQYTAADVEKLGLLKALTDCGVAVGSVATESVDELRERATELQELPLAGKTGVPRIAVLGELLPGNIASAYVMSRAEIIVSDTSRDRFVADLERVDVDVVVVERPVLDEAALAELRDFIDRSGATAGVIVYGFGRSCDVQAAREEHLVPLKAPVDGEDVIAAVLRSLARRRPGRSGRRNEADRSTAASEWAFSGQASPRRFTEQQLAKLAHASTAIDCECPQQLAQLVADLSAFEVYSANCANRDEEDAALHRYLHHTTARARASIEAALQRVAEAEGIDY